MSGVPIAATNSTRLRRRPDARRDMAVHAAQGERRAIDLPPHPNYVRMPTLPLKPSRVHSGHALRVEYWAGHAWQLGSAAYWESIASEAVEPSSYRLGASLPEEVGACLLGGYGMPFALANAAFDRLRDEGVFERDGRRRASEIEAHLGEPLLVDARPRKYRFPRQRATRLAAALEVIYRTDDSHLRAMPDRALRDWLTTLPGVGPKTASWVVRNHRGSNEVAIIDVHLIRAGIVAGVFLPAWRPPRDYAWFESAFLAWARHAELPPRLLDACIWGTLANDPLSARDILGFSGDADAIRPVWPVLVSDHVHQPSRRVSG